MPQAPDMISRDDVLRMAREAGAEFHLGDAWWPAHIEDLERFAALVACATGGEEVKDTIKVRLVYETEFLPDSVSERSEAFMMAAYRLQRQLGGVSGDLDPCRALFKEVIIE